MGNLTQKGKCVICKGQWHWQTTKVCLYIHICIYRHLYRSLHSQSSGIQAHSAGFQFHSTGFRFHSTGFRFHSSGFLWIPVDSCGFLWNPAELMHSCRNLWGIKKYRFSPGRGRGGLIIHPSAFAKLRTNHAFMMFSFSSQLKWRIKKGIQCKHRYIWSMRQEKCEIILMYLH